MVRILLVDHNMAFRNLYYRKLRSEGYSVESVADGDEAIMLLKNFSFALMITDLEMKRVNGYELSRQAKEKWPEMPILMITESIVPDDCMADHVMKKPCTVADFLEQIERLLKK